MKNLKANLGALTDKKALILIMLLITSALTSILVLPKMAHADNPTKVGVISEVSQIGPGDAIGQKFKVAVIIENLTNFYAFGIKMYINTTYFEYVNHTTTVPWNGTYQTPRSPSPYGGLLYSGTSGAPLQVKDEYDPSTSILEIAYSSKSPAPSFNGSGTVCIIGLNVKYQHIGGSYINVTAIKFTEIKLATKAVPPTPILFDKQDFKIKVYGLPQPAGPTVEVEQYNYKGSNLPHTLNLDVSILNLDEYWDLTGFDIKLSFDPKTIQVKSVTLGDFASYYNLTWELKLEFDNETGSVWVAYMFNPSKGRTIPEGDGTLAVLEIIADCTSKIEVVQSKLAAWPHPERSEAPWSNQPYSIAIPHEATDGEVRIIGIKSYSVYTGLVVKTESDYCIGLVEFDEDIGMLVFEIYVSPGEESYVNITIPLALMYPSNTYRVFLNGKSATFTVNEVGNNAYVYITYDDTATDLQVISQNVIPEFPMPLILLGFFVAATLLAIKLKAKRKN